MTIKKATIQDYDYIQNYFSEYGWNLDIKNLRIAKTDTMEEVAEHYGHDTNGLSIEEIEKLIDLKEVFYSENKACYFIILKDDEMTDTIEFNHYDNFKVGDQLTLVDNENLYIDNVTSINFKEGSEIEIIKIIRVGTYGNAIVKINGHELELGLDEIYFLTN